MNAVTLFGVGAVTVMLLSYALEKRSAWWVLVFAVACGASSLYGWLAGTWPFGVVEGIWALVALRRWWLCRPDWSRHPSRAEHKEVSFLLSKVDRGPSGERASTQHE